MGGTHLWVVTDCSDSSDSPISRNTQSGSIRTAAGCLPRAPAIPRSGPAVAQAASAITGVSMRAVGYKHSRPIDHADALIDLEIEKPAQQGRDLLVEVKAVSVNPVDTKVRKRADPKGGAPKILGYDAAGGVAAVGGDARLFKRGDEVFYAGSILRPGTNAEYHLVDERIVGGKPKTLDFTAAAALPLTSITAWEMLFDRFAIPRDGQDLPPNDG